MAMPTGIATAIKPGTTCSHIININFVMVGDLKIRVGGVAPYPLCLGFFTGCPLHQLQKLGVGLCLVVGFGVSERFEAVVVEDKLALVEGVKFLDQLGFALGRLFGEAKLRVEFIQLPANFLAALLCFGCRQFLLLHLEAI